MGIYKFLVLSLCVCVVVCLFGCSREEGGGGASNIVSEGVSQSVSPTPIQMTSLSITVQGGTDSSIDVTVSDTLGNILAGGQTRPGQMLQLSFPLEKDRDVSIQTKNGNSIQKTVVFVHAGESGDKNQVSVSEASCLALFFVQELGNGDASAVEFLKGLLDRYSDQAIIHQAYLELSQEEGAYVAIPKIFEYLESINTSTSE